MSLIRHMSQQTPNITKDTTLKRNSLLRTTILMIMSERLITEIKHYALHLVGKSLTQLTMFTKLTSVGITKILRHRGDPKLSMKSQMVTSSIFGGMDKKASYKL